MVRQTAAAAEPLDFGAALRLRPLWWATAAAGTCLAAACALAGLDPSGSRRPWPGCSPRWATWRGRRSTTWSFASRCRGGSIAGTFRVAVVDAPGVRLPAEVFICYQFDNPDGPAVERKRMDLVGGMMVAQRDKVLRPFSFWVEGGDDYRMRGEPLPVEVVDRPAIQSLDIRWSAALHRLAAGADREKRPAMAGTRLEISGVATNPLASVALCMEGGVRIAGRPTR